MIRKKNKPAKSRKSASANKVKKTSGRKRTIVRKGLGVARKQIVRFLKPKFDYGTLVCLKTNRKIPCAIARIIPATNQEGEVRYELHFLAGRKKFQLSDWIDESELVRFRKPR